MIKAAIPDFMFACIYCPHVQVNVLGIQQCIFWQPFVCVSPSLFALGMTDVWLPCQVITQRAQVATRQPVGVCAVMLMDGLTTLVDEHAEPFASYLSVHLCLVIYSPSSE
jgi:hypothetical protein